MKRILLLAVLFIPGFAAAEDRKDGVSTSGKIGWHVVETKEAADVLISEADQGESAAQKLCGVISVANTKVTVSPDDSWVVVQSGGPSLGVSLKVFRRENGMIYAEQKSMDIGGTVLLAACGGDAKKAESTSHLYTHALNWSADSKWLLVEISARGGEKEVKSFVAIYDLASGKVGFDLEKFNGGGVRGKAH